MSIHRYAAKRDKAEGPIVQALRQVGAKVVQLSVKGFADLVVSYRREKFFLEVKSKYGKLTPAQQQLRETWDDEIVTVRNVDEALIVVGAKEGKTS